MATETGGPVLVACKVRQDFVRVLPKFIYKIISNIAIKFNGIELPFRVYSAVVNNTLGNWHRR